MVSGTRPEFVGGTRPKVAFIGGAGTVGASAAFRVATLDIADEIVLIDARPNMAMSHVLDLEQAVADVSESTIRTGGWDELEGCDVVVLSASRPERNVASRDQYLPDNLDIVREAAGQVAAYCPEAVVIVATNPVDVFTCVFVRLTGMSPRRCVGYSLNDTIRFRWAIARTLGVTVPEVAAVVVGEHGDMQVPLFNHVTVNQEPVHFDTEQRRDVELATRTWFSTYQALGSGRTTGWTSAMGIGRLLEAVSGRSTGPLPCSTILDGEYGVSDVSLGVPVMLGTGGVQEIVALELEALEQERFHSAAQKVRGQVERVPRIPFDPGDRRRVGSRYQEGPRGPGPA